MHEASIVEALLATAAEELARAGVGGRVVRLEVRVGVLSGVHPEALRFAYDLLAPASPLAGAELGLQVVPAAGRCGACGAHSEVVDPFACCPACGRPEVMIEGGQELTLASLEVEEGGAAPPEGTGA